MRLEIANGYFIRPYQPADLDALVKYANNRNVWLGLRDLFPHPYTSDNGLAWLAKVRDEDPRTNFAIASEGGVIGGIGVAIQTDIHRLTAEIGYWLGEPFWGQGIASGAVRVFTEYAFTTFDLIRIFAYVYSNNAPSARVLEKAGYEFEGCLRKAVLKDGKILDMFVYSRIQNVRPL
jgi:RimJ/RimL family protein N-acetyltransferase